TGHGRRVVVVTPYYEDESVTLHHGDALDVLREMPGQSVDCCVTSPPYFGLRSYLPDGVVLRDDLTDDERAYVLGEWRYAVIYSKSQIPEHLHCYFRPAEYGLESSPGEYVETMRALFAEVRRVLADDGTFWLNLGDSYQSSGGKEGVGPNAAVGSTKRQEFGRTRPTSGLASKNLLGIPWRVAFALQDDGWILRNDIIWSKPNAMPESVTDRLSTRHEHLFMFSKSTRYWFDLDPIREALARP